ncbi:MAG TPA: Ppx/GppA phosphatase family protein [Acidimicrobiia bacterium]
MKAGAVDIGTNSMRLLIAEATPDGMREVARQTVVTRLGQGVDSTGRLDPEAMGRTLAVLAEYGSELYSHDVAAVRAVATSASRDASNTDEFFEAVEEVLGFPPEVISGDEEARLAFAGATALSPERPCLVIDIGGGSTEFVFGWDRPVYTRSVDIGSVRLTERNLLNRPADAEQILDARKHVEQLLEELILPEPPLGAIGVAGTFTSLAAINLDLEEYDSSRVHGSTLTYSDLLSLVDFLSGMTLTETEAIPSLDPARAPVILGGAVVALTALLELDLDAVTVSEEDMLHGIARELLLGS